MMSVGGTEGMTGYSGDGSSSEQGTSTWAAGSTTSAAATAGLQPQKNTINKSNLAQNQRETVEPSLRWFPFL